MPPPIVLSLIFKRRRLGISIRSVELHNGQVETEITVENLGGHKLPTAYPSRRVWLHVTLRDRSGRMLFDSGALNPNGRFGNANDEDPARLEPHYTEITSPARCRSTSR